MTRKQERYAVMCFMLVLAFFTYRSIERRIWVNEYRYSEGNAHEDVFIHRKLGRLP